MAFSTTRRFIAGAVCPKCAQLDKIVAYAEDGKDFRECISCGFKDEMRVNAAPRELQTRVNTSGEDIAAQTSAVRIIE